MCKQLTHDDIIGSGNGLAPNRRQAMNQWLWYENDVYYWPFVAGVSHTKWPVIHIFDILLVASLISLLNKLLSFHRFYFIRTLHDCPSQMNENLLISNSKLTSDNELIWLR